MQKDGLTFFKSTHVSQEGAHLSVERSQIGPLSRKASSETHEVSPDFLSEVTSRSPPHAPNRLAHLHVQGASLILPRWLSKASQSKWEFQCLGEASLETVLWVSFGFDILHLAHELTRK